MSPRTREFHLADDVGRIAVPDQERVAVLLRTTADRKGIQASTDVLLRAYAIAYRTPDARDDAALEWVACERPDEVDAHLVAEAMLREWASWTCPAAAFSH
jgi:hypothetical protein